MDRCLDWTGSLSRVRQTFSLVLTCRTVAMVASEKDVDNFCLHYVDTLDYLLKNYRKCQCSTSDVISVSHSSQCLRYR